MLLLLLLLDEEEELAEAVDDMAARGRQDGCTAQLETLVGRAGFAREAELESFPAGAPQQLCLNAERGCALT